MLYSFERSLSENISGPVPVSSYSKTDLPDAVVYYHQDKMFMIGVHDASGGPTICFSDGVNWIDVQTGSAVA